ncbi:MAG: transposase [Nitrospirae bacterium]|nr:transposase [Nitrospirota bacterium]
MEAKELTDADKSEGIQKDIIVRLGTNDPLSAPVRVLEIYHKGLSARKRKPKVSPKTKSFRTTDSDYTILIVTNRLDLPGETIAAIYRRRWQIELFFRWFKCVTT